MPAGSVLSARADGHLFTVSCLPAALSTRSLFARSCFVDLEVPALELCLIQRSDGFGCSFRHLDEAKATRPACVAIGYEFDGFH
jgi:hypothetical protein